MPKKIEIDTEKSKALHAQNLSDREIGKKLGVSGATIRVNRIHLDLPPGKRGPRALGSSSKPARRTAKQARPTDGGGRATIQVDEVFLDGIWADLDIEGKANLISKLSEG